MLGAFGVVTVLSGGFNDWGNDGFNGGSNGVAERDSDRLADYTGLFWHRPWLAGVFTAMLLSLAGIPLTMGFIGKFYILTAGVEASLWIPVIALVVGSIIGLFYYLRIIAVMFAPVSQATTRTNHEAGCITLFWGKCDAGGADVIAYMAGHLSGSAY